MVMSHSCRVGEYVLTPLSSVRREGHLSPGKLMQHFTIPSLDNTTNLRVFFFPKDVHATLAWQSTVVLTKKENAKPDISLKASRTTSISCKRADCGADVMKSGGRVKEHISALSGPERAFLISKYTIETSEGGIMQLCSCTNVWKEARETRGK